MEFRYVKCETSNGFVHRPYVPVTLKFGRNRFPIGHALVDTGADLTLLPAEIAEYLGVELDADHSVQIGSAGGGKFVAIRSKSALTYSIEAPGFRSMEWQGHAYFVPRQPIVLLGHEGCLDRLDLHFQGKQQVSTCRSERAQVVPTSAHCSSE